LHPIRFGDCIQTSISEVNNHKGKKSSTLKIFGSMGTTKDQEL